jgi:hypothetical protein
MYINYLILVHITILKIILTFKIFAVMMSLGRSLFSGNKDAAHTHTDLYQGRIK